MVKVIVKINPDKPDEYIINDDSESTPGASRQIQMFSFDILPILKKESERLLRESKDEIEYSSNMAMLYNTVGEPLFELESCSEFDFETGTLELRYNFKG